MSVEKQTVGKLVAVAALLAATGIATATAGANPPIVTAPKGADVRQAWQRFVACMNKQSALRVTLMPPPQYGVMIQSTGGPASLRTAAQRATFYDHVHAANASCHHFLAAIQKSSSSAQTEAQFRDRALAFARCLRSHGVDVGDPVVTKVVGGFDVSWPPSPGVGVGGPRWQRAASACRSLNPIMGGN
jgi:hypothetical protein